MNLILLSSLLGALGVICICLRRTVVGVLIGSQLLILGTSLSFIAASLGTEKASTGEIFGLFIVFGGVAQLVAGYALSARVFYLKRKIEMDDLRSLKR